MCDTGRAAGTCVCVLMNRVIRIRLRRVVHAEERPEGQPVTLKIASTRVS